MTDANDSELSVDPAPVVEAEPVAPPADEDPRIAELEAKVTEQAAYIEQLEADPYRAPDGSEDQGVVTDQLIAYEQQQKLAEQQAWDRDYGNLTPLDDFPAPPGDDDFQDAGA